MKTNKLLRTGLLIVAGFSFTNAMAGQSQQTAQLDARVKAALLTTAEFLKSANTIGIKAQVTSEEVSSTNEKLQFDSEMEAVIVRPNKFFLRKTGFENVSMWFDGATLTVMDTNTSKYTRIEVNGSISDAANKLDDVGIETPFAGLLSDDLGKNMDKTIRSGKIVAEVSLQGRGLNHIALRQSDVDWQLWTDKATGAPAKIVVTSKNVTGSPSHEVRFSELRTGAEVAPVSFDFVAPKGAHEVPMKSFGDNKTE